MKILIFDNYDSFTYNLVHLVEKILHEKVYVFRNDKISLEEVGKYDKIILSPGPGIPQDAGIMIPIIQQYSSSKSILGVCLGHQGIALAFGGSISNLKSVYHGVATKILIKENIQKKQNGVFGNLNEEIEAGRYHSWIVDKNNLPEQLEVTAEDENGLIMGMQHKNYDVQGVQFHPESVLTPKGETLMKNWLKA